MVKPSLRAGGPPGTGLPTVPEEPRLVLPEGVEEVREHPLRGDGVHLGSVDDVNPGYDGVPLSEGGGSGRSHRVRRPRRHTSAGSPAGVAACRVARSERCTRVHACHPPRRGRRGHCDRRAARTGPRRLGGGTHPVDCDPPRRFDDQGLYRLLVTRCEVRPRVEPVGSGLGGTHGRGTPFCLLVPMAAGPRARPKETPRE